MGLRTAEWLAAVYVLPPDVQSLHSGALGLNLPYYLGGVGRLLIAAAQVDVLASEFLQQLKQWAVG